MTLDRHRNHDGGSGIDGRAVRNRQYGCRRRRLDVDDEGRLRVAISSAPWRWGATVRYPRLRPACVISRGFPRKLRHRVSDPSAYAPKCAYRYCGPIVSWATTALPLRRRCRDRAERGLRSLLRLSTTRRRRLG